MARKVSKQQLVQGGRPMRACPKCNNKMEIVVYLNPRRHVMWHCESCGEFLPKRKGDVENIAFTHA